MNVNTGILFWPVRVFYYNHLNSAKSKEIQRSDLSTVQPDAAGKIIRFWPGGPRQSGLLLGCSKERQPPLAIHYLKCVCSRQ